LIFLLLTVELWLQFRLGLPEFQLKPGRW